MDHVGICQPLQREQRRKGGLSSSDIGNLFLIRSLLRHRVYIYGWNTGITSVLGLNRAGFSCGWRQFNLQYDTIAQNQR